MKSRFLEKKNLDAEYEQLMNNYFARYGAWSFSAVVILIVAGYFFLLPKLGWGVSVVLAGSAVAMCSGLCLFMAQRSATRDIRSRDAGPEDYRPPDSLL